MPKSKDVHHSILIVTKSGQFDAIVKKSLEGFITIDTRKSASLARRSIIEKSYDLVVIDSPLPDETGIDLALDVTDRYKSLVLLVTPQDIYDDVLERVTDYGVLAVSKPFPRERLDKAIRFMVAMHGRIHKLEEKTLSVEEKMEEIRIVSRAKLFLVERKNMSEDEAHRFIGKCAMDRGVSRKAIAQKILEEE